MKYFFLLEFFTLSTKHCSVKLKKLKKNKWVKFTDGSVVDLQSLFF